MAVYTTFFAATDAELKAAFTGWHIPLSKPVTRTRTVAKRLVTYDSWEPDEVLSAILPPSPANPVLVTGKGDYEAYLHTRLPSAVQALPHLATKGVLSPHVEQLLVVVAGTSEERLRPALFPPGGSATGTTLDVLPDLGVAALAVAGDPALQRAAGAMATSEGWFADDCWPADACADLLRELRRIALGARHRSGAVYLLTQA
jgi:hypothetical protein